MLRKWFQQESKDALRDCFNEAGARMLRKCMLIFIVTQKPHQLQ